MAAAGGLRVSGLGVAAGIEIVCVAAPCVLYASVRGGVRARLGLRRPPARALLGAAIIGASLWIVLLAAVMPLQESVAPTPPELKRALDLLAGAGEPLWLVVVAVALVPGVCEELLCRGILLPAFSARRRAVGVMVSASLFALLHLSPYRFVPTFLLGLSLGYVTVVAGSIVPAIVLHLVHNSAVLVSSRAEWSWVDEPSGWLGLAALAICAVGHACVGFPARAALR
ncbi:MAG TPA: CPBP family intramembrane glutamic endopeptidase [Haliangiales bacterium]|nr:CPBP family intramembrane glutamic endopeptidase [Haliangiales bacterium]